MHYDPQKSKQFKSRDEVIQILKSFPLTTDIVMGMVDDGVSLEFISLENKGVALLIRGRWYVFINEDCDDREKEEIVWHELIHLHLRRIFGGLFNDNGPGSEEVHPVIVREGERLAENPPISYQKILDLIGR